MTKFFQKFGLVFFLISIFTIIIIPIVINEAYKHDVIYVTMWGAADVLSYYGTILGATATATAMIVTIVFTRKQIYRDSYLKNGNEKWEKIEVILADALDNINPMQPWLDTMDTGFVDPNTAIQKIQKYQIYCRTAIDKLNSHLNINDYPKVKSLIDAIGNFTKEIGPICQEELEAYSLLRYFNHRNTVKEIIQLEKEKPDSFSEEDLEFCEEMLNKTKDIRMQDILHTIGQLNKQMIEQYNDQYRSLLQLKGATFEQINMEIQENADSILHIWKKK